MQVIRLSFFKKFYEVEPLYLYSVLLSIQLAFAPPQCQYVRHGFNFLQNLFLSSLYLNQLAVKQGLQLFTLIQSIFQPICGMSIDIFVLMPAVLILQWHQNFIILFITCQFHSPKKKMESISFQFLLEVVQCDCGCFKRCYI